MNLFTITLTALKGRVRQFSFWALVAMILLLAFVFVPTTDLGDLRVFSIDPDVYVQGGNPTWIPTTVALIMAVVLPLLGFSYVHDMINLDRRTGTMEMLLANGVDRFRYVFGKLLASFILLLTLWAVALVGSLITMLIKFQGQFIDLWTFVSPFLAIVPGLLFVSGIALLLETSKIFRRGSMNALALLLFFVLFIVCIANSANLKNSNSIIWDFSGLGLITYSMRIAEIAATGKTAGMMAILSNIADSNGKTQLIFTGLPKQQNIFISLLITIVIAILLTFIAALLLEKRPIEVKQKSRNQLHRSITIDPVPPKWRPVPSGNFQFRTVIKQEFFRIFGHLNLSLYLTIVAIWVASWIVEESVARQMLLPILFGLGILPLSLLGCQEQTTGVEEWLLAIPKAPLRQALGSACASISFCLFLASPSIIRNLMSGTPVAALVILSWAVCLPLLALFLGSITKSERPFQLLLLLFLYVTLNAPEMFLPIHGVLAFAMIMAYLFVMVASLVAVIIQRRKQML